jgi:hypothetical protein
MKSLITALVLSAASVLPVSAGVHVFNPENRTSTLPAKAQVGDGQCLTTRDQSKVCYLKTSPNNFSVAILDVDRPNEVTTVQMDCTTGRWRAFGPLTKQTLGLYMDNFCPTFN